MKIKHYARKRRQFSFLLKRIKRLEKNNWEGVLGNAKIALLEKAKKLFTAIRFGLGVKTFRKALTILGLVAGLQAAQAQTFAPGVEGQFNLFQQGEYVVPTFADLDGDGDFDLVTASNIEVDSVDGLHWLYHENIGTSILPNFEYRGMDLFGIEALDEDNYLVFPQFVDIDADGDLDLLYMRYNYDSENNSLAYQENIGTAAAPAFDTPENFAFGVGSITDSYIYGMSLTDLDDDGDLDLMYTQYDYDDVTYESISLFQYFENTGTPQAADFTDPVMNPFGLETQASIVISTQFVDLDQDGDMDLISNQYEEDIEMTSVIYFENTGTAEAPIYAEAVKTPFGLEQQEEIVTLAFADIDGDSDEDGFLFSLYDSSIWFHENTTAPSNVTDISADYEITIHPNPAQEWANIKIKSTEDPITQLRLLDILGRAILIKDIRDQQFRLDLADINRGQYFLELSNSEGVVTRKILVEK